MSVLKEFAIPATVTLTCALLLVVMVRRDFAGKLGMTTTEQWLLTGLLGWGVLFFVIKLAVVISLASVSQRFLGPITKADRPVTTITAPSAFLFSANESQEVSGQWLALPDKAPEPAENITTAAKVSLGEKLFFDTNLSADRTLSCASCHDLLGLAGTDGLPLSLGIRAQQGDRNAPSVWNSAFQRFLFWDGRVQTLEQQALEPLLNPVEMGMASTEQIEARILENPQYQQDFVEAFGNEPISITMITRAIASFERTLITPDTAYDDYVKGDVAAMTNQQLNGMRLFEETGCSLCHSGPNFSAASVFSAGLAMRLFPANNTEELEPYYLTSERAEVYRVPSLRNVALTGPWLHNGQIEDLHQVVRIMASAQLGQKSDRLFLWQQNELQVVENPPLTDEEADDIVAFLQALSSKKLLKAM